MTDYKALVDEAREYSEALQGGERRNWINLVEHANSLADAVEALERRAVAAELEWSEAEARVVELEAVIQKVRELCHTMDRGVGYRVSGDHSTWGEYHEGKSDFSGEVEEILDQPPSVVLADHDAAVWDEGYRAGGSQARRWMSDEPNLPDYPNPYRVADQNGGE